jgi:superfamily II DNA or RNA helicase
MIQIAYNAVDARILNADKAAKLEVHRLLSYSVQGSEHMPSFQSGSWNGKSSFFNFEKGHFPAGFVNMVSRGLQAAGHEVQLVAKPAPDPLGPERPEVDAFGYTERYDYQPITVDRLVQHKQIIAQVATGGGKSRICRMAYRRIARPTLFVTTRGILMYQMRDAVVEMGEEVAVLGDGEWGIPYVKADGSDGRRISKFCVGMVQTLSQRLESKTLEGEKTALEQRRNTAFAKKIDALRTKLKADKVLPHLIGTRVNELLKREAPGAVTDEEIAQLKTKVVRHEKMRLATISILERFELVIAEEAHETSGTGFYEVMAACKNAHYRLALTATPFMKDDEEANMRLLASCGPVAIKITEKMLIDRGILAKPYFKFLKLDEARKPRDLLRSTPWQRAYSSGIVNNEHRNKLMCVEVLRGMKYGLNAMMLVQHKAHGGVLKKILECAGVRVEFIDGDSDQATRQDCLNRLGCGQLDVLIGSTILDVGVDVPSIGMIVLAGGGKAEVALRQRIGRGLREKKSGPNVALVIDVYDEFNNHLKGHSGERQTIIKGTPGFVENIVADFDYAALGFTRKS